MVERETWTKDPSAHPSSTCWGALPSKPLHPTVAHAQALQATPHPLSHHLWQRRTGPHWPMRSVTPAVTVRGFYDGAGTSAWPLSPNLVASLPPRPPGRPPPRRGPSGPESHSLQGEQPPRDPKVPEAGRRKLGGGRLRALGDTPAGEHYLWMRFTSCFCC